MLLFLLVIFFVGTTAEAMIARAPEEETAEWQGMADAVQAQVTAHFFGLPADETAEPETETETDQ